MNVLKNLVVLMMAISMWGCVALTPDQVSNLADLYDQIAIDEVVEVVEVIDDHISEDEEPDDEPVAGPDESDTADEINLANVIWLGENVSVWPKTGNLSSVVFSGKYITLNYDKAKVWPYHDFGDMTLNANPWVFVKQPNGKWYAATWEWLRFGQITKGSAAVAADHIKRRELNNFKPVPGRKYGFMVSTLVRGPQRAEDDGGFSQRTNVKLATWPAASRSKAIPMTDERRELLGILD
jgi:hypothetical protein